MNNQDFIKGFFGFFRPETSKYVERDTSGYIKTLRKELTPEIVEDSLSSVSPKVISFFIKEGMIDYFGLDIDEHKSGGWVNNRPTEVLEERFKLAKKIIGHNPSLIFRSPRGIHAYWFLCQPQPDMALYEALRELLNDIKSIEILPTNRHALSIPSPDRFLNDGLEECIFTGFESLIRYSINAIFKDGIDHKPKSIINTGKLKKTRETHNMSLDKLEKSVVPLKNGQTNGVYIKLVVLYKLNGLNENEAYERFFDLIKKSPGYTGDLLNDLENRIKTSYRRLSEIGGLVQMKSLSDLSRDPQIKKVIHELIVKMRLDVPKRIRMKNSMNRFLLNLISWKIFQDKIFKRHETAYYWNLKYPGAWSRHDEGFYPLQNSLLRKWNRHYDRSLNLLKSYGVLEKSPYNYSTVLKRCKYYRINIQHECPKNGSGYSEEEASHKNMLPPSGIPGAIKLTVSG